MGGSVGGAPGEAAWAPFPGLAGRAVLGKSMGELSRSSSSAGSGRLSKSECSDSAAAWWLDAGDFSRLTTKSGFCLASSSLGSWWDWLVAFASRAMGAAGAGEIATVDGRGTAALGGPGKGAFPKTVFPSARASDRFPD